MEVDIIEFRVPVESNKALFIWDIQPCFSHAYIYGSLSSVFSAFGPLFLVKVCPNAPAAPAGFYALVKFYCARHALQAQRATDARTLFQNTPVKVRLSNRQAPSHQLDEQPLSHSRCLELANHCLGFNGWSTHIINLKELPSAPLDDEGRGQEVSGRSQKTLRYGCLLELSFPRHGVSTRGVAVLEETFTLSVCMQKHSKLQRWARDKALVHAFSSVLLIVLGDGRLIVDLRPGDQLLPEDQPDGVIKVNELVFEEEEGPDSDISVS